MKQNFVNTYLFEKNRQKLIRRLPVLSVAFFVSNDEMPRTADQIFPFRQNSDLFYLTGIEQPRTVLCICPDYPDFHFHEILIIEKTTELHQTWHGGGLSLEKASEVSGIKNVFWLEDFEKILNDLMQHARHVYLPFHETTRSFDEIPLRDARFTEKIKELYPLHHYERLNPLMAELRQIKEPEELDLIRKAIEITHITFDNLIKFINPSFPEYILEAEIIAGFIRNGSSGHAFIPIIASGKNSCVLHYNSNNSICKNGDVLLIDFGAEYSYYNADITRTIPVNGIFTRRQGEIYQAVLRLHDKALILMKKGTTIDKINLDMVPYFEEEMIGLHLLSKGDIKDQNPEKPVYKNFFMHGISHYLGIDVHDSGLKTDILMPGMVITCEPGIYIRDEGIGIRLEDDILITENGNLNLTGSIPIQPDEIEELMARSKK